MNLLLLFIGEKGTLNKIVMVSLFILSIIDTTLSQDNLKRTLINAAKGTYYSGMVNYSLQFTTLDGKSDTFREIYNVFLNNNKDNFIYYSIRKDTLAEMYFNKLLLRSNSSSKMYKINYHDEEEVRFDFDNIYQPLTDKDFKSNFLGDSILFINLYEDARKLVVKVEYLDPGELDEFYFIFTVSKSLNMIIEYSLNARIAGIPIYDNWKILKIKYPSNESDSISMYLNRFYSTINTYEPCLDKRTSNAQENIAEESQYTLNELQGILPTLKLISTKGDTMQMINIPSEYTLVEFWFRSCFPCIKSLPEIIKLRNKYNEEFLNIVSINSIDRSIRLIDEFAENNGIPYNIYIESIEYGNKILNVDSYPTFFIYDREFNLIKTIEGYSDMLFESIDSVLVK